MVCNLELQKRSRASKTGLRPRNFLLAILRWFLSSFHGFFVFFCFFFVHSKVVSLFIPKWLLCCRSSWFVRRRFHMYRLFCQLFCPNLIFSRWRLCSVIVACSWYLHLYWYVSGLTVSRAVLKFIAQAFCDYLLLFWNCFVQKISKTSLPLYAKDILGRTFHDKSFLK